MGEQQYYEVKVFLKNYKQALSTLEYEIHQRRECAKRQAEVERLKAYQTHLVKGANSNEVGCA